LGDEICVPGETPVFEVMGKGTSRPGMLKGRDKTNPALKDPVRGRY